MIINIEPAITKSEIKIVKDVRADGMTIISPTVGYAYRIGQRFSLTVFIPFCFGVADNGQISILFSVPVQFINKEEMENHCLLPN